MTPPVWVRFAVAGCVVLVGALTLALSNCWCSPVQWVTRLVLVSLIVVSFGLELWIGRAPRWLFAASIGLPVAWLIVTDNAAVAPLFLLLMVAWTVTTGSARDALIAVALATLAVLGYVRFDTPDRWLPWIAGVAATGLMMRLLIVQQRLVRELRAAQADLARQAVANERRRIAAEIHDIAAHALAVMVLHLTGARMRLQREGADPGLVESLAQAERLGRQSLDDVRRTVGLLREESTSTAPPLPGAADIRGLVAEYQTAGLDVELDLHGDDVASVPPATGLATYRIVQESLANAVKHAPGSSVHVRVDVDGGVRLQVRNSVTGSQSTNGSGGHGLEGMRERARLLGGWLRAGPSNGAWLVECAIPDPGGA
jgi:signal transduction histidine kinase